MSEHSSLSVGSWATEHLGLRATHRGSSTGRSVEDLIVPGLRRNPRRAHLWVSTVLGKHIPVVPSAIFAAADDLADLALHAAEVRTGDDVLVFGFAETATGLGHGVAHRLGAAVYLHSTRRTHPTVPTAARFEEGHSHATDHLVQPTDPDLLDGRRTMILVDDEISTGATAIDAIESLHDLAPRSRYVVAALVDMRSDTDRERCGDAARRLGIDIAFVSLAQGLAEVPDDLVERVAELTAPVPGSHRAATAGTVVRVAVPWPHSVPDSGRHGFLASDEPAFAESVRVAADGVAEVLDRRRPVLVIGHEEFMYLPQRLSAELEARGWQALSQTTTRSPAVVLDDPGYPLRHGFEFTAPEARWSADATRRYLYNAAQSDPAVQRVLVVDTAADTAALWADDGVVAALTGDGRDLVVAVVGDTRFDDLVESRVRS